MSAGLAADSPHDWLDEHLAPVFDAGGADAGRPVALAELLADDAAHLRSLHNRLRAEGTPARAAAKYLAGWYGGMAGTAVAYAAAGGDAGFLLDPATLRWRRDAQAWPAGVQLGAATALVAPGHAWSGLPRGVTVVEPDILLARTVGALVETLRPLVAALRELSTVGPGGLWAEIADCLGSSFAYGPALAATPARVSTVRALLDVRGAPWRTVPSLWLAPAAGERMCVVQKGGCCLAYTEPAPAAAEQDGELRRFEDAFPEPPGARRYCDDCRHRSPEDCEARQVWRTLAQSRAVAAEAV